MVEQVIFNPALLQALKILDFMLNLLLISLLVQMMLLATVGPLRDIPEQFHEVILNGAIARGYKDPTNFKGDMYQFFNTEFDLGIKSIKKHARTKTGTGFVRPQSF